MADHSGLSVEEQRAGRRRRANPCSDYAATARDQIDDQHNQGDHQQEVNQATRDVEAEAQQPHNQQDHKNGPEHGDPLLARNGAGRKRV